jgi:hypothetical protein
MSLFILAEFDFFDSAEDTENTRLASITRGNERPNTKNRVSAKLCGAACENLELSTTSEVCEELC